MLAQDAAESGDLALETATAQPPTRSVVARNALWRVVEVIGAEALSFAFMLALARLLAPADFGVVATAGALIWLFQVLLFRGLAEAVVQLPELSAGQRDAALWANLGLGLVLSAAMAAAALPMARVLAEPTLAPVLLAMAPLPVLFGAIGIWQAALRRALGFGALAIRTIAAVLAGGAVGVALALAGAGVWSLVGQQLAYASTSLAVLLAAGGWRPRLRLDRPRLGPMVRLGTPVTAAALLDVVGQGGLILLLAWFLSATEVGLLFLARRIVFSVSMLTTWSVSELNLAILSRLQATPDRHREAVYASLRVAALVCLPAFVGMATVAEPLVRTLFGANWLGTVPVLQVLALAAVLQALPAVASSIFTSQGVPEHALRMSLLANLLLLASGGLLAAHGVVAVAVGTALAALAVAPAVVARLCRVTVLDPRRLLREQAPIWLATAAMAACVLGAGRLIDPAAPAGARLALAVVLGIASFVAALGVLAPALARWLVGAVHEALAPRPSREARP